MRGTAEVVLFDPAKARIIFRRYFGQTKQSGNKAV